MLMGRCIFGVGRSHWMHRELIMGSTEPKRNIEILYTERIVYEEERN